MIKFIDNFSIGHKSFCSVKKAIKLQESNIVLLFESIPIKFIRFVIEDKALALLYLERDISEDISK